MVSEFTPKRFIDEVIFQKEIEKLINKLNMSSKESLTIGLFLEQKTRYVFGTDVLQDILTCIKNYKSFRLLVFYRDLKNIEVLTLEDTEEIQIRELSFNSHNKVKDYERFDLSEEWLGCDLRIIATRPALHTHHSEKIVYGLHTSKSMLARISDYDTSKISIGDYEKIIYEDSKGICSQIDKMGGGESLVIADLQDIKKTDEHSFFSKAIRRGTIALAISMDELEKFMLGI